MNLVRKQGQLPHLQDPPHPQVKNSLQSFLDMSIDEEEERVIAKRWTEKQQRLEKEARVRRLLHVGGGGGGGGLADSISSVFLNVITGRNTGKAGIVAAAKCASLAVSSSAPTSPVGKEFPSRDVDTPDCSRTSFSSVDSEDSKTTTSTSTHILAESPTLMPKLHSKHSASSSSLLCTMPTTSDTNSVSSPKLPSLDDSLSEAIEVDWITAIGEDYLDSSDDSMGSPASTLLLTPPSSPVALSAGVDDVTSFPTIFKDHVDADTVDDQSLQIAALIACLDLTNPSCDLASLDVHSFLSTQTASVLGPAPTPPPTPCLLSPPSFLLSDVDSDSNVVVDMDKQEEGFDPQVARSTAEAGPTMKRRPDPALLSERWRPRGPPLYLTVRVRARRSPPIPQSRSRRRFGFINGRNSSPETESPAVEVSVFPLITYAAYTLAQLRWTIADQLRESDLESCANDNKNISCDEGGMRGARPSGESTTTMTRRILELEGNVSLSGGRTVFLPLQNEIFYRQWVRERLRAGAVGEIECWCST